MQAGQPTRWKRNLGANLESGPGANLLTDLVVLPKVAEANQMVDHGMMTGTGIKVEIASMVVKDIVVMTVTNINTVIVPSILTMITTSTMTSILTGVTTIKANGSPCPGVLLMAGVDLKIIPNTKANLTTIVVAATPKIIIGLLPMTVVTT